MKIFSLLAAAATAAGLATSASAAQVNPVSYDMLNGTTGSYNYWDDSYTGTGNKTQDAAYLSGGLGDLTDGVIATQNWDSVESPLGPNGPYVGWELDPSIRFNFASAIKFSSVTFYFDDSQNGGVAPPASIKVGSILQSVANPAGTAPFSLTMDLSSLAATDTLIVDIERSSSWVFLSEVQFDAPIAAVPLPAGGLLLLTAFGGLAALRRRTA